MRGGRPAILGFGIVFAAVRCSRTEVRSAPVLAKASPKPKLAGRAVGRRWMDQASGCPVVPCGEDAPRSWVLASFSLRSGAHVLKYAPLLSSRKPRQGPSLRGGRLGGDGWTKLAAAPWFHPGTAPRDLGFWHRFRCGPVL